MITINGVLWRNTAFERGKRPTAREVLGGLYWDYTGYIVSRIEDTTIYRELLSHFRTFALTSFRFQRCFYCCGSWPPFLQPALLIALRALHARHKHDITDNRNRARALHERRNDQAARSGMEPVQQLLQGVCPAAPHPFSIFAAYPITGIFPTQAVVAYFLILLHLHMGQMSCHPYVCPPILHPLVYM